MVEYISADKTYPLRQIVLRPNLPLSSCYFDGDHNPETRHLAYCKEGHVLSIISVMENISPITQNMALQLRGMATHPEFQGQGLGEKLIKRILSDFESSSHSHIWCNARTGAMRFYEKNRFQKYGRIFQIEGVGEHQIMFYKWDSKMLECE